MSNYNYSPRKASTVIGIILFVFFLILIRVWYLAVIKQEEHIQLSKKPQRKTVTETVERATICDRFGIPLAVNKIQYDASICYANIRQIPAIRWKRDENGKRVKVFQRREYIKDLCSFLSQELQMEAQEIEDLIHGKASLFPHTPFVIKQNIQETQYYRLKSLERTWPGIQAQRTTRRYYPQGKVGGEIIGYLGAISQQEYFHISNEIKELSKYVEDRESGLNPVLPKGFQTPFEVRDRLKELKEKAYTINDLVGKAGIEKAFDAELRGYAGRKTYEIDVKGNYVRELPGGRIPVSGKKIYLSISSELQEFAEALLAEHEKISCPELMENGEEPWIKAGAIVAMIPQTGEIVAMASYPRFDPNDFIPQGDTEELKEKSNNRLKWLESELYVGKIWNGIEPVERECYDRKKKEFFVQKRYLDWKTYIKLILHPKSQVKDAIEKIRTIGNAWYLQESLEKLRIATGVSDYKPIIASLYSSRGHIPSRLTYNLVEKEQVDIYLQLNPEQEESFEANVKFFLDPIIHNDDKLLLIDLCRLICSVDSINRDLIEKIGGASLEEFFALSQAINRLRYYLQPEMEKVFNETDFMVWREGNFKEFLKEKRKEEKVKKSYARPYTEYLEAVRKKMFRSFWSKYQNILLEAFIMPEHVFAKEVDTPIRAYIESALALRRSYESDEKFDRLTSYMEQFDVIEGMQFLKSVRSFSDLKKPLVGKYRLLKNEKGTQFEKHLAAAFYPATGIGYARSQAFRQSTPLGSIFKIVTSYEGLKQRYYELQQTGQHIRDLSPLTLTDQISSWNAPAIKKHVLGFHADGKPIYRFYKGGILPRGHFHVGKVNLKEAFEQSSNLYFAMLAGDYFSNPENLVRGAKDFGFAEKTGVDLPGEIPGSVPDDISYNKTGLYAMAIGQHSLVVTPLQTARMISTVVNKGKILKPKIVKAFAGVKADSDDSNVFSGVEFAYQEDLNRIGIYFPIFTANSSNKKKAYLTYETVELQKEIFMPDEVRQTLFEAMRMVIKGPKGTARPGLLRRIYGEGPLFADFQKLQNEIIGKTSTAQILYKGTIDAQTLAVMIDHVWFGGIGFKEPVQAYGQNIEFGEPELVVVTYLKYGRSGADAAPYLAQMLKKWREISKKHQDETSR